MPHKNPIVQRLGEWVFPQRIEHLAESDGGYPALLAAIEAGLVMKSQSKIGLSVQSMRKISKYAELTPRGWDEYRAANKQEVENHDQQ
jgi:hypothetical protein